MNYSKITHQIWVGSAIDTAADIARLIKDPDGPPTRIIDCRIEFDDSQLVSSFRVLYLWDGTEDWTASAAIGRQPKPLSWFKSALDFWMPYRMNPGEIVHIHCSAGVNRSATMAYAFLLAEGWSQVEAVALLNAHRFVTLCNDFMDHPWREDAEKADLALGHPVKLSGRMDQRLRLGRWKRDQRQLNPPVVLPHREPLALAGSDADGTLTYFVPPRTYRRLAALSVEENAFAPSGR